MATIYISSTYTDLKEGREKIYKALRQMRHNVIAMEDYVATDQRPLEKCLADVEQCDLYIGIFAWRYGYVPGENNPEHKSITELEYRKAVETNKSPLIFLHTLGPGVAWYPEFMDAFTGEGERGERIKALRDELQAKTTIGPFHTFDELAQLVSTAVSNWSAAHSSKSSSPTVDDVNRRKYLEKMSERYGTVKLPIGPPEGFYLHAVFQPLMLRSDPLAAEDLERRRRRPLLGEVDLNDEHLRRYGMSRAELERLGAMDAAGQTIQHTIVEKGEEALEKSPQKRVVILGGPGTGKTTTLKYLAGQQAQRALASPDVEIPIFIQLPAYAQSGKTLQSYLIDVVGDMKAEASYAQVLWKEIDAGRAFLCLDSLDEVAPQDRPRVIEQINLWAADKGNTWIVGSRFTEYKGGQFRQGQFAEWELLPMNALLRRELARRLLPELQRLLKDEETHASVDADTFVDILEHHTQAAAWGENPLLFSLAAVVYLKIGTLPTSRAALYRQVIEAVLKTREPDPVRRKLLERLLTDLALWLHQKRGRTFTMDDLIAFLLDQHRKTWGDTTDLIHRIISSGIIEIVAHDTYAFRHQTFQEYLAAHELARRLTSPDLTQHQQAWDLAWSKRTYSRWTEILRLMVGVLAQTTGTEGHAIIRHWLQALLAQKQDANGDPGNLGLALALKSLTEVSEMDEWASLNLTDIEQEITTSWIEDLLVSAQYNRATRVKRLQTLAYDIGLLREPTRASVLRSLKDALSHRNENVREAIVGVLGAWGERLPLRILFAPLQDRSYEVRNAAQNLLCEQGANLLHEPLLTEALKHVSSSVRRAAVTVLGEQGERVPVEMLLEALHDEDVDVQMAAVTALGKQGERVPVGVLLEALHDEDGSMRRAAVAVLGGQGERVPVEVLLEMLQDKHGDVRSAVVRVLGEQGERVPVEVLIEMLQSEDLYVRSPAVEALGKQGERVPVEVLVEMLQSEDLYVQSAAVKILSKKGERVPVEVLLEMLHNEYEYIRYAAVEALGKQGERVPVKALVEMLQDKHEHVRSATIKALSKQGEQVPVKALVEMLQDKHEHVRSTAVEVLGEQGEQVPMEVLVEMLQDGVWDVRRAVVKALSKQGERVPVEVLIKLLRGEKSDIRKLAEEVLRDQKERKSVDVLIETLKKRAIDMGIVTEEILKEKRERVKSGILIEMLQSEYWQLRSAAVELLDKRGEQVPVEVLIEMLQDEHEHEHVRSTVVKVLGKQGERISANLVLAAIGDDSVMVRDAVIHLLSIPHFRDMSIEVAMEAGAILQGQAPGKFFDSIAQSAFADITENIGCRSSSFIEPLMPMLNWHYWQVRMKAARALGKIRRNIPDEAIQRLLELRHDPVRAVREAADDALAEILSLEAGMEDEV